MSKQTQPTIQIVLCKSSKREPKPAYPHKTKHNQNTKTETTITTQLQYIKIYSIQSEVQYIYSTSNFV